MKIYAMNDYDWYAAESEGEAVTCFCDHNECTPEEAVDEYGMEPRMLTDEEMQRLWFVEDGGEVKKTYRVKLREMIEAGEAFPCFFASTEY